MKKHDGVKTKFLFLSLFNLTYILVQGKKTNLLNFSIFSNTTMQKKSFVSQTQIEKQGKSFFFLLLLEILSHDSKNFPSISRQH